MKGLGTLLATVKDESLLYVDDCTHDITYKLYRSKDGYKILRRHSWRFYNPLADDRVYSGAGGKESPPGKEVDEHLVVCDQERMEEAVSSFWSSSIPPIAEPSDQPMNYVGRIQLRLNTGDAHSSYKWLRQMPPKGWEPISEFAETILDEYEESEKYEEKKKRLAEEVKARMVKSYGVKARPECGLIQAGFVHESKWRATCFGPYQGGGRMSNKDRLVLSILDVGNIELLDVQEGYSDNYPYFEITLQANWQQYHSEHKVSYAAAMGGLRVDMDKEEIIKILPDKIDFDIFNDGTDIVEYSKEQLLDMLGDAEVSLWICDPRIALGAYVSLVQNKRLIDTILDEGITSDEAVSVLRHYNLFRDRVLEKPCLGDAYTFMERMLKDMRRLKGGFVKAIAEGKEEIENGDAAER